MGLAVSLIHYQVIFNHFTNGHHGVHTLLYLRKNFFQNLTILGFFLQILQQPFQCFNGSIDFDQIVNCNIVFLFSCLHFIKDIVECV